MLVLLDNPSEHVNKHLHIDELGKYIVNRGDGLETH
jgi:hypothetical protein